MFVAVRVTALETAAGAGKLLPVMVPTMVATVPFGVVQFWVLKTTGKVWEKPAGTTLGNVMRTPVDVVAIVAVTPVGGVHEAYVSMPDATRSPLRSITTSRQGSVPEHCSDSW
jgi:hypothetical protein